MEKNKHILKQFKFYHEGKANENAIIKGEKYRFTILTDRLFRLEYSENGYFVDEPSQVFWFRKQPVPPFDFKDKGRKLEIITKYWKIVYEKECPFSESTLVIQKINDKSGIKKWYYGMKTKGNLKGTYRTLDNINGNIVLENGLLSKQGFTIIDDSKTKIFNENGWVENRFCDAIDLYFFGYEKDFKTCIKDFYRISGKVPLLPRYIFGNWWSRYWNYNENELKDVILKFEERNIPLSVCVIDMDWHYIDIPKEYGDGWTGYTWNKNNFPDPKKFICWLKSKKIRTSLNLHPALGFRGHEECYYEVAKFMGVNYQKEEPVIFDSTDPKFINAYFTIAHHPYEKMGIDFWWIDWQQGTNTKLKGLDPLWMLNHLHFLDSKKNKRGLILSRWPGLGGHRYPIGFSGDTYISWESLSFQPYFTATAANVGYGWWSHDIGGHYHGIEDPELYVRWVQFGVFSPIFRLHSTKNYYLKREPWRWNKEVEYIVTTFMKLRHQLIPYIYTMNKRNADGDLPLITPLYYDYPDEHLAYKYKNQYMFGSELLVSPQITPTIEKLNMSLTEVWLPEGIWFDFFNGDIYNGNKIYQIYSSLREIPVFAKAGAIIPMAELIEKNQIDNPKKLIVHVFPGANNNFELYEDDGETNAFQKGNYALTKFNLNYSNNLLKFLINVSYDKNIIPKEREYILVFHSLNKELEIIVNKEYKHTFDDKTNTHFITIKNINNYPIEIEIKNNTEEMIKDAFNYKAKIMSILEQSTYPSDLKAAIGYDCQLYNHEKKGIIGKYNKPKDIMNALLSLDLDKDLKNALFSIILRKNLE